MGARFRIADLIVLVLFTGLIAFTMQAGDLFAVVPPVVFLGSVCVATVGRSYRQGSKRAAWSTFALFGWTLISFMFLIIVFDGSFDEEAFMYICMAGFLGAGFSAYVAGRLVPRGEAGPPPGDP